MINFDGRTFRSVSNTTNGQVSEETVFEYQQAEHMVSAIYQGGDIVFGHLIGIVNDNGELDIRYHHLNIFNELMTGICHSIPEILPNGKLRLHERWKWTSGDESEGESIIEEV